MKVSNSLLIAAHLHSWGSNYPLSIEKTINGKAGFIVLSPEGIYTTLRRMEKEGFVSSEWGDRSGQPRRRYYRLTGRGEQSLKRARRLFDDVGKTF